MNITFEDDCWSHKDSLWQKSLLSLLTLLEMRQQHAVLANPSLMVDWCNTNLPLYTAYFKARLSSAVSRTNSLKINISPTGASVIAINPPWILTAGAAWELINAPLRVMLENDNSDNTFLESTISKFSIWRSDNWIDVGKGGGSAMENDIKTVSTDIVKKWRTFFMFDSDRLHPDELAAGWNPPSGDGCQGHKFEVLCSSIPRERWHRLKRRSIENYLPEIVLNVSNPTTAATLFGASIGEMAHFYNVKNGLRGDGIHPLNPAKSIRAGRCKGFWTSLPSNYITSLEAGFGTKVFDNFCAVPPSHAWSADVLCEMDTLAQALLDAI